MATAPHFPFSAGALAYNLPPAALSAAGPWLIHVWASNIENTIFMSGPG